MCFSSVIKRYFYANCYPNLSFFTPFPKSAFNAYGQNVLIQWVRDVVVTGFLLDFHGDVERLRIDTEVTSLYDISFQHHDDVVAIR